MSVPNGDAVVDGEMPEAANEEIASIERRMASDRAGYFADKGQQARYRALVTEREGIGANDGIEAASQSTTSAPATDDTGARLSEPLAQVAKAWRTAGDFDRRTAQGNALLAAMNAHLGDEEGRAFASSIDGLPDATQAALAEEAAMPAWGGRTGKPDANVLKAFTASPEFAGLVNAWHGPDSAMTARKVAILNARLGRALGRLNPKERSAALDWWERLPGRDATALVWHLTGGTR